MLYEVITRVRGEDIGLGSRVLEAGATLRPPEISLLASFGMQRVEVVRRARVAILSTGDELVEVGEALDERTIVNSNSWSLAAAVKELGGEPVMLGIARDNRESLLEKLSEGLEYDALITRITSYNVCYTELLRPQFLCHQGDGSQPDRGYRIERRRVP